MTILNKRIPVMEVFGPTLQGEGPLIGQRVMFVRFGLCDMKCLRCDSMHAVDPAAVKKNSERLTQEEIFERLQNAAATSGTKSVVLSGGNPCIHDLTYLVHLLRDSDWEVSVETQGTKSPAWLNLCNWIIVSPKSPGMGEEFDHDTYVNFYLLNRHHEGFATKIVIFDQQDIEFAVGIFEAFPTPGQFLSVGNTLQPILDDEHNMTSPSSEKDIRNTLLDSYKALIEDVVNDPRLKRVIFLPQLHVLIWGNDQEV